MSGFKLINRRREKPKMDRGRLIILSGPSGSGKSTVVSKAMNSRQDLCFSVSVTTRPPRPGEVDGKDYFFISREQFHEMVVNDELLEHAEYVSNSYGTPRKYVEDRLDDGINVILDIEIQGARQVRERMPDALTVFVLPPSMEELRCRLEKRGTDSAEVIEARIRRAREELLEADFYDYLVINDDAELAAEKLCAIITASHCRFDREFTLQFTDKQKGKNEI